MCFRPDSEVKLEITVSLFAVTLPFFFFFFFIRFRYFHRKISPILIINNELSVFCQVVKPCSWPFEMFVGTCVKSVT